ncbi:MAG: MBL fold metallo-hydrolase [Anaerolineae bacterium]|nr:MBL fold metallo-hydrolase [Anaerolineae bacterium]
MLLKYFYDNKIAHASYMVGCQATSEAIIVDPARAIEPYLQVAAENGLKIVASTETHIHADFLSGSRELAKRAGAKLYLSDEGDENWKYEFTDKFDYQLVKDGDIFKVGNIKFEVMHTPGHTPEHISFLVTDTAGANQPIGIFTGDFVFVGDIGRPDLLEEAAGIKGTAEPGARRMFHSLKRFKALADHVQVWPAHGAGSACGKALGAVPSSTVGYEKLFNWAMAYEDEDQFVKALLSGQPEAPFYFAMMKKLNKVDRNVLKEGLPQPAKLGLAELEQILDQGAVVVDTRSADEFAAGHIPGTVNIPLDNSFTNWAGWLLGYEQAFYLIGSEMTIRQAVRDLIYIGLDNIGGYFDPSILETWSDKLQSYQTTTPTQIADKVLKGEVTVLDIRALSEWNEGHLPGAKHIMLGYLPKRMTEIPTDKPVVVHCRTQNRSAIGASVLQAKGIPNVVKMQAGYQGWAAAGLPIERNGK